VIIKGREVKTKSYIVENLPYADRHLCRTTDFTKEPKLKIKKGWKKVARKAKLDKL